MSRLTLYQVCIYERCFQQFASKGETVSVNELSQLMILFGPRLNDAQIAELIYKYDRNCAGSLTFDDFLELLADYETVVDRGNLAVQAFEHFQQSLGLTDLPKEHLLDILKSGDDPLTDDEISRLLGSQESVSVQQFADLAVRDLQWVDPLPTPLSLGDATNMRIVVRVFQAINLDSYAVPRKRQLFLDYQTMDPYVSVTVGDNTKDTSVLVGELHPEWNQEIQLSFRIPSTNFVEAQYWIENTRVLFNVYDYNTTGIVPHGDWLGSASLPLTSVLRSVGTPAIHMLQISSPHIVGRDASIKEAKLEVSVMCLEEGVVEYFTNPTDRWLQMYFEKMRSDLSVGLRLQPTGAEELNDDFVAYFGHIYREVHNAFPRRNFLLLHLDEYNTFRALPCFVRPMLNATIATSAQLAEMVAEVPTNDDVDVPRHRAHLPSAVHMPPLQICSPSLMLYRGFGTVMEHAILLCSLLLGSGFDAYVCIGAVSKQPHVWVVTLTENKNYKPSSTSQPPSTYQPTQAPHSPQTDVSRPTTSTSGGVTSSSNSSPQTSKQRQHAQLTRLLSTTSHHTVTSEDSNKLRSDTPSLMNGNAQSAAHLAQKLMIPKEGGNAESVTDLRERLFGQKQGASEPIERTLTDRYIFVPERFVHISNLAPQYARIPSHWESTTGQNYDTAHCPYDHAYTMFNHENVWLNVQRADTVDRMSFDVHDVMSWMPFLSQEAKDHYGPIECWYSEPPFLVSAAYEDLSDLSVRLTTKLMEKIQVYRNQHLYISETRFHRELSKYLFTFFDTDSKVTQENIVKAEEYFETLLPPHTIWTWRQMKFHTNDVDEIMRDLTWMQILDSSALQVSYMLSVRCFVNSWGVASAWVMVGYITDVQIDSNRKT